MPNNSYNKKKEWVLKDSEGKIIAKFYRYLTAKNMKSSYEKIYLNKLIIERIEND